MAKKKTILKKEVTWSDNSIFSHTITWIFLGLLTILLPYMSYAILVVGIIAAIVEWNVSREVRFVLEVENEQK